MRDQDGAAAVEFSLIAILLFSLLFGILHFGLTYSRQQGLHAAAREGARLASLGDTVGPSEVRSRVTEVAPPFIIDPRWEGDGGHLVIDIAGIDEGDNVHPEAEFCQDHDADGEIADERVEVAVAIDPTEQDHYNFGLPLGGVFTPNLSVAATFQCEQERP